MTSLPHMSSPGLHLLWSVLRVIVLRGAAIALSFIITMLVVDRFGTSATADSLMAVRRVIIRLSDAGRMLSLNALVPFFVRDAQVADPVAWGTAVRTRVYQFTALGLVIACLISFFSADIVAAIGAGFDASRKEQAGSMLRVFAFMIPSFLAIGVLTAAANARSLYGLPELFQLLPRFLVLIVLTLLPAGMAAVAVPWVYVLGSAIGGAVLLLLAAPRAQRPPAAGQKTRKPTTGAVTNRFWALIFTMVGTQLALLLQIYYASKAGPGAITYLECSQTVMSVLPAVVMRAAGSVAYVESARHTRDNDDEAAQLVSLQALIELGLYVMLPIIILIGVFAPEISKLLFVRGAFTLQDAQYVAGLTVAFSAGSIIAVVQNALNISILLNERLPLARLAIEQLLVMVLSNLVLLGALTPFLGVYAIPIAVAGSGLVVVVLRFVLIRAWRPVAWLILRGRRFRLIFTLSTLLLGFVVFCRSALVTGLDPAMTLAAMAGVVAFSGSLYFGIGYVFRIWTPAMLRGRNT